MPNRWLILFVLFFARMTMSFQFQAVGSVSPHLVESYGASIADIGMLIGLYLAPGVVVAVPGGAVAALFGDKRTVCCSLILMLIGGAMIGWGPDWGWLVAGRLLAGVGGVAINIVMTKMLMDWFVDREISTAMAIFINSWPVGIALALLVLPGLAAVGGLDLAWAAVMFVIASGLVLLVLVYRPPPNAAPRAARITVNKLPLFALFLASCVWALYNAALILVFSFAPAFLQLRGWDLTFAGSVTSIFIIAVAIAIPFGGIVADRSGRRDGVIMVSLLGYALLLPLVLFVPTGVVPVIFVIVGLMFGLGAGPIVTLPSLILPPDARAFGTGVYYSIYYAIVMVAPALAGAIADHTGSVGSAFITGSVLLVFAMLALGLFRRVSAAKAVTA